LAIPEKRKLPGVRDQHVGPRRLQQRGKRGGFGAAHGGIIAGLRGAVRISGAVPVSGRLQRAGVKDAPGM
jgi:hypothetical protein